MIKINKINTKKVTDAFIKYGDEAVKELGNVVKITGQEVELNAKSLARVDDGTMRNSIRNEQQETPLQTKVTAYMPYSAYHEFGTGGLVDVPAEWSEMAMQFKGAGIKQVNIMPQPFMYPAYLKGKAMFNKEIRETIKYLNKKFNG